MRGCVSAGMIAAVSTFGLMDSFDAVYGSSAGSLVGAYAIAAQVRSIGRRALRLSLLRVGFLWLSQTLPHGARKNVLSLMRARCCLCVDGEVEIVSRVSSLTH